MNNTEDDDIKLQRASASLLSDLQKLLTKILRKKLVDQQPAPIHRRVRQLDLHRIFALIDPFQEDPQLLDAHLKNFIPPLIAAYLEYLFLSLRPKPKKHFVSLSHAVCRILNLFCKVRGEKVIAGFLNNEPRYLEPILLEYERGENFSNEGGEGSLQSIVSWEERYILLLWLTHLMLAPFPLATISATEPSLETSNVLGINLPTELPGVTLRVLQICVNGLKSATKERNASANLLVRLSVRPDMQKTGLLDALVRWALSFFYKISENLSDIHQCLGMLSFLSGLVSSATNQEIGPFLPAIYRSCQDIISQRALESVRSSAVARKLIVKTLRNIVVHCLQATPAPGELDTTGVLEEVIEFLLEALADGDTPVRYAASKALSVVTMKLQSNMAGEVVDAILGSLDENVYWQGSKRSLSGVNPLRWHGLTLTLSHLLYRKAVSTDRLPEVLNALLLALAFEQRSATGGSIGTNVRDAACFGVWALSRRYLTKDLLAVEASSIRASQHYKNTSITQVLAIELVVVACLDPAGNIRRGSSAALQELIGRHPNTVEEGIPLVQVVDFHGVGLREKAMCKVAFEAAQLHQMYWNALFENLLGWRGVGSLDAISRVYAAAASGRLSQKQPVQVVLKMADQICHKLKALKPREIEERHGLVLALGNLVDEVYHGANNPSSRADSVNLSHLWRLFEHTLRLEDKSFTSPSLRPELTAIAISKLLSALASIYSHKIIEPDTSRIPSKEVCRLLNLCLVRTEDTVLVTVPRTARAIFSLLTDISPTLRDEMISTWMEYLQQEVSYNGLRGSGYAIALGAVFSQLGDLHDQEEGVISGPTDNQAKIIKVLAFRCTTAVEIPARTVALQALSALLEQYSEHVSTKVLDQPIKDQISSALQTALNDYTVTERGDVGSLVRLEALNTLERNWHTGLLEGTCTKDDLHAAVLRLSLEKLDKVRAKAALVLEKRVHEDSMIVPTYAANGVSSYAYFASALKLLELPTPKNIKDAVLLGYVSSAGMGSESVVQNSRAALVDFADGLPAIGGQGDEDDRFSVTKLIKLHSEILKAHLTNERILLPLMETLAFLFDMQIPHRLIYTGFNFTTLLSLTQKSHYKSTHIQKLHLALDLYRGLGTIPSTRAPTLTKVCSMLGHPFPKIRIAAAETLWLLTQEEGLKRHDWSAPAKSLKGVIEEIRESVVVATA